MHIVGSGRMLVSFGNEIKTHFAFKAKKHTRSSSSCSFAVHIIVLKNFNVFFFLFQYMFHIFVTLQMLKPKTFRLFALALSLVCFFRLSSIFSILLFFLRLSLHVLWILCGIFTYKKFGAIVRWKLCLSFYTDWWQLNAKNEMAN